MNWNSICCMFGMALTRPSLTMQLMSIVDVFAHVCGQKANTSSNYCDNIQPYDKRRFSFYRATRMLSADYVVARYMYICLSVRLSVTRRYSVKTVIHILTIFLPSRSFTILGFSQQTGWQYSDGDLLTGALNARVYEKITIFDQYLALSRKWCKIEI